MTHTTARVVAIFAFYGSALFVGSVISISSMVCVIPTCLAVCSNSGKASDESSSASSVRRRPDQILQFKTTDYTAFVGAIHSRLQRRAYGPYSRTTTTRPSPRSSSSDAAPPTTTRPSPRSSSSDAAPPTMTRPSPRSSSSDAAPPTTTQTSLPQTHTRHHYKVPSVVTFVALTCHEGQRDLVQLFNTNGSEYEQLDRGSAGKGGAYSVPN